MSDPNIAYTNALDDHVSHHTRNLRKKVNYAELENSYDFVDFDDPPDAETDVNGGNLEENNGTSVSHAAESDEDINVIRRSTRASQGLINNINNNLGGNTNNEGVDEIGENVNNTRSRRSTRFAQNNHGNDENAYEQRFNNNINNNNGNTNKHGDDDDDDDDEYHYDANANAEDNEDYVYSTRRSSQKRGRTASTRNTRNSRYRTSGNSALNDFIEPDEFDEGKLDNDDSDDYGYSTTRRSKRGRTTKGQQSATTGTERLTRNSGRRTASTRSTSRNNTRSRRLKRRGVNNDEDEDEEYTEEDKPFAASDEDISLKQELQELQEDSPVNSPKRSLRKRTKNVNYVLPLPTDLDNNLEEQTDGYYANNSNQPIYGASSNAYPSQSIISPRRRLYGGGKKNGLGAKTGPVRKLFATGGPFGGNDVTSIFGGVNVPTYIPSPTENDVAHEQTHIDTFNDDPTTKLVGTSIDANGPTVPPSLASNSTNFANNASLNPANNKKNTLILDSDSSDDEILPFGEASKKNANKKSSSKSLFDANGNALTKKPETADVDPLGVDMNIDFNDVGGLDNYIDQLKEMVALPLLYPELYATFNITPPRGVLFHGPPGTGKTLMARALAASCSKASGQNITFFMRKGADILSKWVGEAERQLRLLFEEAKKNQPSIIFFDEIDGLAPVRSSKQEQIHASIVSTMLALMDGMDNRGQVIVIGATNRPDSVDPALRRPGRFDREFYFPLPDVKGRNKIIQIHTKKWKPPLPQKMIDKLAELTKGYGGADLRSLCTEAALSSIQRRYPQIYQSSTKFKIDPNKVHVSAKDFMLALEKIVPSSARGGSSLQQPLPKNIECLLHRQLTHLENELELILPKDSIQKKHSDSLIKHYLEHDETVSDDDEENQDFKTDGGFGKQEFLKELKDSRVSKPRFLLCGKRGNGQQYIGSALLNFLEGINIQNLDLSTIMSETTKTMEASTVQVFTEARKRQPAVIYIPNFDVWIRTVAPTVVYTLTSLLRSLRADEKVLLMAIADGQLPTEPPLIASLIGEFEFETAFELETPNAEQRHAFFSELKTLLCTKPTKFSSNKKRVKPVERLPEAEKSLDPDLVDENGAVLSEEQRLEKSLKKFQHLDMKLKNTLKIKLSGLMELFKNRYKKFRKAPIDDIYLIHLFEPLPEPAEYYQPAYVKDGEKILEVATGKRFFNMDLDVIEERLWNGFYSEPKQFLKDIEMIYLDAHVLGDRERIIKSSEMFANAQVGIEEIATPEFAEQCKATRKRENLRLKLYLKKQASEEDAEQESSAVQTNFVPEVGADPPAKSLVSSNTVEVTVGAGSQVQSQLQKVPEETVSTELSRDDNLALPLEVVNVPATESAPLKNETQLSNDANSPKLPNSLAASESLENAVEPLHTQVPANEEPKKSFPDPEFIVNDVLLTDIIERLTVVTNGWPVQMIQQKYAKLVSCIWKFRYEWDKKEAIEALKELAEQP
ncbi:hypothetical protein ACO0RG_002284 [Hanseniaspora osmophila]|uniref:Tat-binding 7 n=1 Tax=Hanseniaspora osmophila TaxID=56408 RepID=A0A1E5RHW7_9ASCO|nr:Tat-binding 7 [Hanseniaspora osmophila]